MIGLPIRSPKADSEIVELAQKYGLTDIELLKRRLWKLAFEWEQSSIAERPAPRKSRWPLPAEEEWLPVGDREPLGRGALSREEFAALLNNLRDAHPHDVAHELREIANTAKRLQDLVCGMSLEAREALGVGTCREAVSDKTLARTLDTLEPALGFVTEVVAERIHRADLKAGPKAGRKGLGEAGIQLVHEAAALWAEIPAKLPGLGATKEPKVTIRVPNS